jgi:hypothetical protein
LIDVSYIFEWLFLFVRAVILFSERNASAHICFSNCNASGENVAKRAYFRVNQSDRTVSKKIGGAGIANSERNGTRHSAGGTVGEKFWQQSAWLPAVAMP